MKLLICAALLGFVPSILAVICPDLDLPFENTGTFDGWPDSTCPGSAGLDLLYRMYTPLSSTFGTTFDRNSVPSIFDNSRTTVFLVHGWNGDESSAWPQNVKDRLLTFENVNVVVVSWGGSEGAQDLNYFNSAADTRTVGAETAEVMINLINSGGGSRTLMHLAGHSLGAHVVGHAGRWATRKGQSPARVTGLDPAGPNFAQNPNRDVGIYDDSAVFVDIIFTDRSLGSTPSPGEGSIPNGLGHHDFFPNNGDEQPGCSSDSCSHGRAHEYFLESIDHNCFEATQTCTDPGDLPGSCSLCLSCPVMGYHATRGGATGMYHLTTFSFAPYC